jgi:hypothetical protein
LANHAFGRDSHAATGVAAQIAACSLILDRGCGKAGQSLAIAVDLKKRISE